VFKSSFNANNLGPCESVAMNLTIPTAVRVCTHSKLGFGNVGVHCHRFALLIIVGSSVVFLLFVTTISTAQAPRFTGVEMGEFATIVQELEVAEQAQQQLLVIFIPGILGSRLEDSRGEHDRVLRIPSPEATDLISTI